jgi:hypothetical protein
MTGRFERRKIVSETTPDAPVPSPARLRAQQRSIEVNDPILIPSHYIRDLRRDPPATPDPNFSIPRVECCGRPMICEAFNDSGEIFIYMVCESCEHQSDHPVAWPFIENRAGERDFKAIGINYEY